MLARLKLWFKEQIYLPVVRDTESKVPSTILFFVYVSFVLSVTSIIAFHIKDSLLIQTSVTICFFALCVIFYKIKNLTKAKIDFDDREVEFEDDSKGGDSEKTK